MASTHIILQTLVSLYAFLISGAHVFFFAYPLSSSAALALYYVGFGAYTYLAVSGVRGGGRNARRTTNDIHVVSLNSIAYTTLWINIMWALVMILHLGYLTVSLGRYGDPSSTHDHNFQRHLASRTMHLFVVGCMSVSLYALFPQLYDD